LQKDLNREEVVKALHSGMSRDDLTHQFCMEKTARCTEKKMEAVMPRGKRKDHKFVPKTEQQLKYDKIIDALTDAGVMGNDDGSTAPDIVDRFDNVLRMLEESGEL
jgi:hypothetical protein